MKKTAEVVLVIGITTIVEKLLTKLTSDKVKAQQANTPLEPPNSVWEISFRKAKCGLEKMIHLLLSLGCLCVQYILLFF